MAIVSVAVPFTDNWYFDSALDGVRAATAEAGHDLDVWVEPPGREARQNVTDRITQQFERSTHIGAVVFHHRLTAAQAERLTRGGKPVVLVGGQHESFPVVRMDDVEVARRAVEHLLDLGHRDIAHLGGAVTAPDDFTIRADRVRGYSEAMSRAGLEAQAMVRACAFEFDDAKRAALSLLSDEHRPTAVFAVVDEVAFGVLAAARELNLAVPQDLSVIGIDDHDGAAASGLTTIRQRPADVGRMAVDRLLGRTDDDDQVVEVEFVQRSTTAPPPSSAPVQGHPRGRLSRFFRGR